MDAVSYAHSAKQAKRIKRFIENPDSNSGVLTQPKVIEAGETVTIKSGRQAILADTVVDGDLVIEAGGEVFVPAGATFGDLESQIALKADTSYVDGKYSGFKNYIINGNFDIWQRGGGPFTNYKYGPDRWICGNGTHNQSASSNIGKTIIHITNTVANASLLLQAIELNLTGYNAPFNVGKTFTISIRYSSSTRIKPMVQFTTSGSGASPVDIFSTAEYKGGSGIDEVVSWTFTVPNNCGATNNCALLAIISESVASNFYISYVQLEEGSVATPFENRPIGLELSLCQRYYEKGLAASVSYASAGAAYQRGYVSYSTGKRSAPSVILTKNAGEATGGGVISGDSTSFIFGYVSTGGSQEWIGTYTSNAEL